MKNIKKVLALILTAVLCMSTTACAAQAGSTTATLETSETPDVGEEAVVELKNPADYTDDIQGLCSFMEDCKVTAGERIQMEYKVIGALNGYKYSYKYEDSQAQLEVYEFPAEGLTAAAQEIIASVREKGSFKLLDNTIPAQMSADGRFMLIYTDEKAEKEDANKAHKEHVVKCFESFTAE